jgi:ABC-type branched-subunit amino acid transport system ATPase component/branched-subunit amino acid ABC-type transport system permease component
MNSFLPFIVIGLTTGAVYGLAGTGLVLTYKTSGIFNFAYGSIAALSVFIYYFLHVQHGMAWPLAALICLLIIAPTIGLLLELLARSLGPAETPVKIVGTVGIVLIVLSVGLIWYPQGSSLQVPPFLPQTTVVIFGTQVGWDQITIFLISLLLTVALYLFFRISRLGVAMRGVVDNPDLLGMTGENPVRVRRWAWVIGSVFATLSGLLLSPSLGLDATVLTMLVVQAFGAAAVGYFSSLPLTYAGGLLIGIAAALVTKYATQVPSLAGLTAGLPFIVLFVVLVATPRAKLVDRRVKAVLEVRRSWYAPDRVRLAGGALAVLFLAIVPTFAGIRINTWSETLATLILFLSLGLLVKGSGQVSLCHYAFAAVGAASMGHFTSGLGLPWLAALALSGLVAIPVGAIVAIPAVRLSGVFLALATLGFGILLEQMFYTMPFMFGPTSLGIRVSRPHFKVGPWNLATDKGYYWLLLLIAVLTVGLLTAIHRGRLGRLLRGMADSPLALSTHGTTVNFTRLIVFSISAFVAAISGALIGALFQFGVGTEFPSFGSLTLFALVVIIVAGEPWYGVIAAGLTVLLPSYLNLHNITNYLQLVFGLSAVLYVFTMKRPLTVPIPIQALLERVGGRGDSSDLTQPAATSQMAEAVQVVPVPRLHTVDAARLTSGLEVEGLSVRFGGVLAVDGIDLVAPLRQVTGLIGPNGAGKSTTFNACCGLLRPASGRVRLNGRDITDLSPQSRARRSLGRTFQRVELFDSLSVQENVELGFEALLAGSGLISQMRASRSERAIVHQAAEQALEMTGIRDLRGLQASLLSGGQRRLVELARVLAGPYEMLLLDEPSSGLDEVETQHFGNILQTILRERQVGILLVEHDMGLVRQVCEDVFLLDFGRMIFHGSVKEMLTSDIARAAYLGSEAVVEADPVGI